MRTPTGIARIWHLFFPLNFMSSQVEVLSLNHQAVKKTSSLCQWGNPVFMIETRLFEYSAKIYTISRCITTSFVLSGTVASPQILPVCLALEEVTPLLTQHFPYELL